MIIEEKNPGTKVSYSVEGNVLSFRGGELALDLSKFERDFPVHIDVSSNKYDMLQMGLSEKYVAQVDIPARVYNEVTTETVDEEGNPVTEMVAAPFNVDEVKLTLWEVE